MADYLCRLHFPPCAESVDQHTSPQQCLMPGLSVLQKKIICAYDSPEEIIRTEGSVQVIYLNGRLVKKGDKLPKRERWSRSKLIKALIESFLEKGKGQFIQAAMLERLWEIIDEIYKDRRRNRRPERLGC